MALKIIMVQTLAKKVCGVSHKTVAAMRLNPWPLQGIICMRI